MSSKSSIYCITEYYRGSNLKAYLENETLTKSQFKSLIAQVVVALGQIHECNLVYNSISVDDIFVVDEGYILLNNFAKCCETNIDAS